MLAIYTIFLTAFIATMTFLVIAIAGDFVLNERLSATVAAQIRELHEQVSAPSTHTRM